MRERERQEVSRGKDCCAASPKSTGAGSPGALITRLLAYSLFGW